MVFFQDSGETVSFSPGSFTRNPPWSEKLLASYFLIILVVSLVRLIQLVWCLWTLRGNQLPMQDGREKVWMLGKLRARALMRFAVLTCFLCVLEVSFAFTNDLWAVGTQKVAHSWWILVSVAEDLGAFNFGMVVCVVLYSVGFFFESWLDHRKLVTDATPSPPEAPTS